MNTVLLNKDKHDRNRFDCGIEPLNNYLKVMANQQAKKDNSRTFVLEDDNDNSRIIGFYTLTLMAIELTTLPDKLQKKHSSSTSAGLIARLAVDKHYYGRGFGEWLLIDALRKLVAASDTVAFPLVVVDAKDGAQQFYQRYGFQPFQHAEHKLLISIEKLRTSLNY